MSAQIPPLPRAGAAVVLWAKRVHNYLRSITIRGGANVKVKRSPSGTTISILPNRQDHFPFQVLVDEVYEPTGNERNLKIRSGRFLRHDVLHATLFIQGALVPGSPKFNTATGPTQDDFATANVRINDGETVFVYLQFSSSLSGKFSGQRPNQMSATFDTARPPEPLTTGGDNIKNWNRVLAQVTNTAGEISIDQEWRGGNITESHVIPDGDLDYESVTVSRVESLDYIEGAFGNPSLKGPIQDRQVHEILVDGANVTEDVDDFAIPYFDYQHSSGVTEKKYARLDTHDADAKPNGWGKSLQIAPVGPGAKTVMQLFDFHRNAIQVDDDANAVYVIVDVDGNSTLDYQWPAQIDDGTIGLRPRNTDDGGAFGDGFMTNLIDAAGGNSTLTFKQEVRTIRVDRARVEILGTVEIDQTLTVAADIDSGDINWGTGNNPPVVHHDETDPTPGLDLFTEDQWFLNDNHNPKYWGVFGAKNTVDFPGTSSAAYHTTGDVRGGTFALESAPITNTWTLADLKVAVGDVSIEGSTSALLRAPSATVEGTNTATLLGGVQALVTSSAAGNAVVLDATGGDVLIQAVKDIDVVATEILTLAANNDGVSAIDINSAGGVDIDCVDDFNANSSGGIIQLIGALGIDETAQAGNLTLTASTNDIEMISGTDISLIIAGNFLIDGETGQSVAGHTKGVLTEVADFDEYIEELAEAVCLALC